MNREIKFRAWSPEKGRMLIASDLGDPYHVECNPTSKGFEIYSQKEFKNKLMQYTGLKDKNGVEIYEGDIVRTADTPHLTVPYLTYQVAWWSDVFSDYRAEYVIYRKLPDDSSRGYSSDSCTFERLRDSVLLPLEVIGNIYENRGLLK